MRKLLPWLLIISMCFWAGCSSDDDNGTNGNGGDPVLTRVPVNSSVPAPDMSSVNHSSWTSATAVALPVSLANAPAFAALPLAFTDSVWVQAIKASGRLYMRLQWDDEDVSLKRDNWALSNISGFNWTHNSNVYFEDQTLIMFDMGNDSTWDVWNWRALTTGQSKAAEGMTYTEADSSLTVDTDNGQYTLAWANYNPGDNARPRWIHEDTSDWTGDVLFIYDTLPASRGIGDPTWEIEQTVPGWAIVDSVLPAGMKSQSRWDIEAVYAHDSAAGRYTLVLARDLTGAADDLDISSLAEVRTRIGILDDFGLTDQGSNKVFTEDFLLDF